MSDNITKEEIWQCYVLFMSIPNETWTDVLKLLSRRILVQKISPLCKRLKNISNRNVDNVHVITEADRFNEELRRGDPEARQQLEHLAGNGCQLASQFRLTRIRIIPENTAILRNCIELFHGCRLKLTPNYGYGHNEALIGECLTHLEAAKPFAVYICLNYDPQLLFNQFLRHPTIWNCDRIKLTLPPIQYGGLVPFTQTILDWLHHRRQQPIEVDDGSDDDDGAAEQPVLRCLIINNHYELIHGTIDFLINACFQNLQQSQGPEDRRRFVISFFEEKFGQIAAFLDQFEQQKHNQITGETMLHEHASYYRVATVYRLRRCLAEEAAAAADGEDFYGKIFTQSGLIKDDFVVHADAGPIVEID